MLAPPLSAALREAAREFAAITRASGLELADDWLNNGPSQLAAVLPAGWQSRVQVVFAGRALLLHTLERLDLLRSKVFALCDRALDLGDCVALRPSSTQLESIRPWLEDQDANPDWPAHVRAVIEDLQQRLATRGDHGL